MASLFARDSVIRRVTQEPAIMFGSGRALLLQLAHPAVAQGVADHSDFQSNPFKRLLGTLEATYAVVMGSEELAAGVGRRIGRIHDHVTGPTYEANDPANLLWVHATLFDSALSCYERLVRPLSPADAETFYEEMAVVAEVFGCRRADQPATLSEYRVWFDEQVRTIEVTDTGRRLAADIVRPPLPLPLRIGFAPAIAVHRLVAIGTTPERLREQLGFDWDDRRQRRLDRIESVARTSFRITPRPLRIAPGWVSGRGLLWLAGRHAAASAARASAAPTRPGGSRPTSA